MSVFTFCAPSRIYVGLVGLSLSLMLILGAWITKLSSSFFVMGVVGLFFIGCLVAPIVFLINYLCSIGMHKWAWGVFWFVVVIYPYFIIPMFQKASPTKLK